MVKRYVTDDEILELGTMGGDWSFQEVESLLEKEHEETKRATILILQNNHVLTKNLPEDVKKALDIK